MTRTAEDYAGAIRALLPRGRVWQVETDSGQQRLILALAQQWARLDADATDALEKSLPGSNLDLVTEWEESLGLPDPCAGADATIEQRAAQVLARFVGGGGQS
ncbi:putative phage tail protein [uncultured Novosphingobium sp.]|uniref:putative phage tail protein n=1 Tax=uncultured Novosphingobium sp. TaxID=292277 RepID=UPI00259844CB|nr:putative phage tail protein [uncultured Novosphingobium sp.]